MEELGRARKRNDIGPRPLKQSEELEKHFQSAVSTLLQASLDWLDVYSGDSKVALAEESVVDLTLPPFSFVTSVEKQLGYYQEPLPAAVSSDCEDEAEQIFMADVTSPTEVPDWLGEEVLVHVG